MRFRSAGLSALALFFSIGSNYSLADKLTVAQSKAVKEVVEMRKDWGSDMVCQSELQSDGFVYALSIERKPPGPAGTLRAFPVTLFMINSEGTVNLLALNIISESVWNADPKAYGYESYRTFLFHVGQGGETNPTSNRVIIASRFENKKKEKGTLVRVMRIGEKTHYLEFRDCRVEKL